MSAGRAADTGHMARTRLAFAAAMGAACLLVCTLASPALGQTRSRGVAHCTRARGAHWVSHHVASRKARCRKKHGAHRRTAALHHKTGRRHRTVVADSNGACPYAGLTPSDTNIELVRAATMCLVNRERQTRGLQALHWNGHLESAAQAHTESMALGGYFEHVGPSGDTPLARMRRSGYIYSSQVGYEVGENIGWGSLWLGTPRAIVAEWMASPGHRANILDPHFRDTGIGVSPRTPAHGQTGGMYTEDFGVVITG